MTRQKRPLDPPVLAGVASVANHRDGAPVTVVEMMSAAIRELPLASLGLVDLVVSPRGTWVEADPARAALAVVRGDADGVRSIVTEIGVLQQTAVHLAVDAVRSGSARAVLVVGGEAKYSSDRRGVGRDERGDARQPDEIVRPVGDILHRLEIDSGLVVPVQQYALIESAIARAHGRSLDEQAAVVADLYSLGSSAAVGRSDAWRSVASSADDITAASPTNPLLAAPYRRAVVSSWTVDQAVALLVTSASTARGLGLADDDVVGLVGSATSDHMVPLVARRDLDRCPVFSCGALAIEAATGVQVRDADVVDLYSCFPSAVEVAASELGLVGRPWTVTGGMATFGGPFNSYALHGIAAVAQRLLAGDGALGVTTCVSGILTKGAVALWCRGPGDAVLLDVSEADRAERVAYEVVDVPPPDAQAVAETRIALPDETQMIVEIVEGADGTRSIRSTTV